MFKNLFSQQNVSPESFWKWFQANESRIWNIDRDPAKITKMVRDALDQFDPGLVFEIAMSVVDGKRQFFISDGGISNNSPKVDRLCQAAPAMDHWRVIKNYSEQNTPWVVEVESKPKPTTDIRFQLFNDGDKVGILLMFPDFSEAKRNEFTISGPMLLKTALGDQNFTYMLGFIDYAGPESNFYTNARPLSELHTALNEYFHNCQH